MLVFQAYVMMHVLFLGKTLQLSPGTQGQHLEHVSLDTVFLPEASPGIPGLGRKPTLLP